MKPKPIPMQTMKASWEEYYRKEIGNIAEEDLESLHVMFYSGALAVIAQILDDAGKHKNLKAALNRAAKDVAQTLERITEP